MTEKPMDTNSHPIYCRTGFYTGEGAFMVKQATLRVLVL